MARHKVEISGVNTANIKTLSFEKMEELFSGNYELMTNCLVNMLYNNPVSKQFVWDLCGNYMLDKLLKDNENKINIPVESEYGIEWQGVRYSIIKEEVN